MRPVVKNVRKMVLKAVKVVHLENILNQNVHQGKKPVYDANGIIVCVDIPDKTKITDCIQNNCNCKVIIDTKNSVNPPKGKISTTDKTDDWGTKKNNQWIKYFPQGAAKGTACVSHGSSICITCPTGFKKVNNNCVPYNTICPNGEVAPIFGPQKTISGNKIINVTNVIQDSV